MAEALENGIIAGAGLDVREIEPPTAGDAIVQTDKAVLTPHIAAFTNEAQERVAALFSESGDSVSLGQATGNNGKLDDLSSWLSEACACELSSSDLAKLDLDAAQRRVSQLVENRYRPEMRRMERVLLLQILDQGWKEHLLSMDHLRSSVGLRGYAQIDPKVEYKREGMKMFEQMWSSVASYVTDLIFKMENGDKHNNG